jgi:hypothetical protein
MKFDILQKLLCLYLLKLEQYLTQGFVMHMARMMLVKKLQLKLIAAPDQMPCYQQLLKQIKG